jgi:hypothetical protein
MTPASGTVHRFAGKGIAELLDGLAVLASEPVDATSFETVRADLADYIAALRSHLRIPAKRPSRSASRQLSLDPGLPGLAEARALLELALESDSPLYAAAIWVERAPLILNRYGQGIAEQLMQVCSQQVISRMLHGEDQLFYWGAAGLLAVLQRDEDIQGVRSELMRVLATPVNQYFETEHRTIYLPVRLSGELFPVSGTLDGLQEQIQKYFSART